MATQQMRYENCIYSHWQEGKQKDFQKVAGMNTPDRVYKLHSNTDMEEAWVYPTR